MSFAIIETGGKQYKVAEGAKLKIEKIVGNVGDKVNFDKVLLSVDGANVAVGAPYITDKVVAGEVIRQARSKKLIVFRFHPKSRFKRKKGHRQEFTEIKITKVK